MQNNILLLHIVGILGCDTYMKNQEKVRRLVDTMYCDFSPPYSGVDGYHDCVSVQQGKRTRVELSDPEKYIIDTIVGMMKDNLNRNGNEMQSRNLRLDNSIIIRMNSLFRALGYSNYEDGSNRIRDYIGNSKRRRSKLDDESHKQVNKTTSQEIPISETSVIDIIRPSPSCDSLESSLPMDSIESQNNQIPIKDMQILEMQNCVNNKGGPTDDTVQSLPIDNEKPLCDDTWSSFMNTYPNTVSITSDVQSNDIQGNDFISS